MGKPPPPWQCHVPRGPEPHAGLAGVKAPHAPLAVPPCCTLHGPGAWQQLPSHVSSSSFQPCASLLSTRSYPSLSLCCLRVRGCHVGAWPGVLVGASSVTLEGVLQGGRAGLCSVWHRGAPAGTLLGHTAVSLSTEQLGLELGENCQPCTSQPGSRTRRAWWAWHQSRQPLSLSTQHQSQPR